MAVKLAKKKETVFIARCQWEVVPGITGFGLLWEREDYDKAADIVDRHAVKQYSGGRFYHAWLEQVTRYDDGSEESFVVREYNRPGEN